MTALMTQARDLAPPSTPSMQAAVAFEHVAGRTVVTRCHSPAPMKLLTPQRLGHAAWAYMSSYGGGLVAGDRLDLRVDVGPGATAVLTTQASTKVYHQQDGKSAQQLVDATVGSNGTLIVAPDPITCFADARYEQRQQFDLASDGSLLLLDWFTAGRLAHGERWAFDTYASENIVRVDGEMVACDRLRMDREVSSIDGPFMTNRYNCFAMVMLVGPALTEACGQIAEAVREQALPQQSTLPISFSPMPWGGVLRLAGMGAEPVRAELERRLAFIGPTIGGGLWHRKW